jgi:2-methylaconitate cis-trans-isomerase PrpF
MPCVILRAADLGIAGTESPADLEADAPLRARLEAIRRAGPMMNLGDVTRKSVPKMTLVSPPRAGRNHLHPHLHPAPLPRRHRRPRRGHGGHRLPPAGLASR